jgi:hypothetical protein
MIIRISSNDRTLSSSLEARLCRIEDSGVATVIGQRGKVYLRAGITQHVQSVK